MRPHRRLSRQNETETNMNKEKLVLERLAEVRRPSWPHYLHLKSKREGENRLRPNRCSAELRAQNQGPLNYYEHNSLSIVLVFLNGLKLKEGNDNGITYASSSQSLNNNLDIFESNILESEGTIPL